LRIVASPEIRHLLRVTVSDAKSETCACGVSNADTIESDKRSRGTRSGRLISVTRSSVLVRLVSAFRKDSIFHGNDVEAFSAAARSCIAMQLLDFEIEVGSESFTSQRRMSRQLPHKVDAAPRSVA